MFVLTWAALALAVAASPGPAQVPFQSSKTTMSASKKSAFTPKELLELPRPGVGIANPAGDLAIVGVSEYSFEKDETKKQIYITSLSAASPPTPDQYPALGAGEVFWLDDRTVGHVVSPEGSDVQELYAVSFEYSTEPEAQAKAPHPPVLIGKFPPAAEASNFKYSNGTLAFSSYVYDDDDVNTVKLHDEERAKIKTTAQVYDSLYVRHWDHYIGPKHSSLFATTLKKVDGKWGLGTTFASPLKGTKHSVPVEPFGGAEDFDVYEDHIVYTTKEPSVNDALHTIQNVFTVSAFGSEKPKQLTTGKQGATHNPVFNHDGSKTAWLELAEDGYEADEARVVIHDRKADLKFRLDFARTGSDVVSAKRWDRSPSEISFSRDGKSLVFIAGDHARIKVYHVPIPSTPEFQGPKSHETQLELTAPLPIALTTEHAASGAQHLPGNRILYTESSFYGPNNLFIINHVDLTSTATENTSIKQITNFGEELLKTRDLNLAEEFWFKGANDVKVQGWAIKPRGWKDEDKKGTWPVLLLIHGGPQGAWEDQWSTRWNPQIFAQHGYFVVAINPTGSTTFGQSFTDAIQNDWGGKPIKDVAAGFHHALEKWPQIDKNRAVAAGASYGGFAINWIAGHQKEHGFDFKALVTHDGIFDTRFGGYVTEELFFFIHEFGGLPYEEKTIATAEKFNPANFVKNWTTPHLIIHGAKDYRLPETDGLAAFTALQLRGVKSRLLLFPDENHWVLKPANSLKWHEEVLGWLDSNISKE